MAYTPPAGFAVDFDFPGGSYTPPDGDAANFDFSTGTIEGRSALPGPLAAPAALANLSNKARSALPGPLGAPAAKATTVWVAKSAIPGPLGMPRGTATVLRYELRGEVRGDTGALLVRRVRAYRRDTGALVVEGDSAGGKVRLDAGLTQREYCLIPIDLDAGAIDFTPPCANRVESVLADDVAWESM